MLPPRSSPPAERHLHRGPRPAGPAPLRRTHLLPRRPASPRRARAQARPPLRKRDPPLTGIPCCAPGGDGAARRPQARTAPASSAVPAGSSRPPREPEAGRAWRNWRSPPMGTREPLGSPRPLAIPQPMRSGDGKGRLLKPAEPIREAAPEPASFLFSLQWAVRKGAKIPPPVASLPMNDEGQQKGAP